jgi:hypothetical protein
LFSGSNKVYSDNRTPFIKVNFEAEIVRYLFYEKKRVSFFKEYFFWGYYIKEWRVAINAFLARFYGLENVLALQRVWG